MKNKQLNLPIDKWIVVLYFISITTTLYFSSLAQSDGNDNIAAPIYILLFPFGVAFLQMARILMLSRRHNMDALCGPWLCIFIYYILAFLIGSLGGQVRINYNTAWFIICPPAAWWYFSMALNANTSLKDTLISTSFWFLLIFSFISLYFIPQSLKESGLFASLNTGYYVLCIYPLAMLSHQKIRRIVSTLLMLIVILLSMKRGGYLAVGLAFMISLFFSPQHGLIKKLLIIAFTIGALAFLFPIIDDMTSGTLTTRIEFTQNGGDEEGRTAMYPKVWKAVWNSDFLEQVFGHGLNAVSNNKVVDGDAAHNDYLEFLYDFGIIGLALLLFYQWRLFKITRKSITRRFYYSPTIFAFTIILVLSMVSILYAFYYFLAIIPFWGVMDQLLKEDRREYQ